MHTNTQQNLLMKKISNYCNSHSSECLRLRQISPGMFRKGENLVPTLGVIQTLGSQKSAKSKRSNIRRKIYRMDSEHGRICKEIRLKKSLHKNMCKIPGLHPENQRRFFNPSLESNASSHPMRTSREREFIVDSMSESDLTPEEQETIQRSKDPSVMTANGTARTIGEATVCVCDLDIFVEGQLLKESLRYSRCEKKAVTRMNDIQVSHHISSRKGENRM